MKSQSHRFLKTLLASAVLVTSFCIAGPVKAVTVTGTYGKMQWSSDDGVTASITGCVSNGEGNSKCEQEKILNVPSTVTKDGTTYSVTKINSRAFTFMVNLEKLSIPDTVISMGDEVNERKPKLTTVNLGSSINTLGSAFFYNGGLRTVRFKGNAPTTVGGYSFATGAPDLTAYRLATATGFGSGPTWTAGEKTMALAEWDLEVPTAPADLVATIGARSASISFTDAYNNGSEIARYEYSINNGVNWLVATQSAPMGPIVLSGLTVGTTYSLKLRARNNVGLSASSDAVTFVGSDVPSAPTNLSATRSDGPMYVPFTPGADNGSAITRYEYTVDNGTTWVDAGVSFPLRITGLNDATTYSVKVRAVNALGVGESTAAVTVRPKSQATVGTSGGLKWSSVDGATVAITGCVVACRFKVLNIPSTVTGGGTTYSVTRVDDNTLKGEALEKLSIPDSVTSVGYDVAEYATNLSTITLGSRINRLHFGAFWFRDSIRAVRFKGNAPTAIDNGAFAYTSDLITAYQLNGATGFGSGPTWRAGGAGGKVMNLAEWQLEAPTAPADLVATSGAGSVSIAFTDAYNNGSEITRYEYSINNGVTWITATQSELMGPIVLTGLTIGASYSLKLRAVNALGAGEISDAVTFVGLGVPSAPTNLSATRSDGPMYVPFTPSADNGSAITRYEYTVDNGTTWVSAGVSFPLQITGLNDATTYSVKVRAVNAVGAGETSAAIAVLPKSLATVGTSGGLKWSSVDGATAAITGCVVTCSFKVLNIPSVVTGVGTTYSVTRVDDGGLGGLEKLSIPNSVASLGGDLGNYGSKLTTVTLGSGLNRIANSFFYSGGLSTIRFTGNAPRIIGGTTFANIAANHTVYRLAGATGFGDSTATIWKPGEPRLNLGVWQGPEAPTEPADLVATSGSGSVSIAFTHAYNNGSEITRYEYSINNGVTWATASQSAPTGPVAISGLTIGTTYSLKLRAVNGEGTGPSSDAVTFKYTAAPSAPTNIGATRDNSNLTISFAVVDNGAAITHYQYTVDDGATWTNSEDGSAPLVIDGFDAEMSHTVKVRAVNAVGVGAISAAVTVGPNSQATTGTFGGLQWSSVDGATARITGCVSPCRYKVLNIPGVVTGSGTPYRVTRINDRVFNENPYLEKLSIPDSVVRLGEYLTEWSSVVTVNMGSGFSVGTVQTFSYSRNLSTVRFKGNAPTFKTGHMFFSTTNNITAYKLAGATGFGSGSTWMAGEKSFNLTDWELTAPDAPIDLVIAPADKSLSVSFTDAYNNGSEITKYEYSVDNGVTWATATQPVPMGPVVITGLTNGVAYQVKLRAANVVGTGVGSEAVTGRPESVPSAPTNVVVTRGDQSLSISFSTEAVVLEKITNYEYSIDNGVTWVTLDPVAVSGPIVVSDLTNGTRYQVKLRAVNNMGVGASSAAITGRPAIAPGEPTNLVVTPSDASLSISLTAGAINGEEITNYEYSLNDGVTWTAASPSVASSPVVIRGLTNGTTYSVKLRAVNAVGSGASSMAVTGKPVAVPSAPTNVVVTRGDQSLSVAFTPAAPNGEVVTNYEYSTNDGATWVAAAPSVAAGPVVISGLTNGTRYPVKLRAVNAVGKGVASNSVTGRPAIAPAAPTNLVATRDDASLSIAFTAGANNGEELTRYQYSIDNGATWARVPGGDVKSPVRISGLTNGTTYSVLLRAVNDVGGGASSVAVTGKPREPLLADSAGKDVLILNDPAPTVAAKSDLAVRGTKIYIALVTPQAAAKVKAPVTYYQFLLTPKKKGAAAIRQTYRVLPDGKTTAILTGKPKTSYSLTVTAITSSGTRKTWKAPLITTE